MYICTIQCKYIKLLLKLLFKLINFSGWHIKNISRDSQKFLFLRFLYSYWHQRKSILRRLHKIRERY